MIDSKVNRVMIVVSSIFVKFYCYIDKTIYELLSRISDMITVSR